MKSIAPLQFSFAEMPGCSNLADMAGTVRECRCGESGRHEFNPMDNGNPRTPTFTIGIHGRPLAYFGR